MCIKEMAEHAGLRKLCERACNNQKEVTRITNGLIRIGITTVEEFMATDIDECMNRITNKTSQRNGSKTRETLMNMKRAYN